MLYLNTEGILSIFFFQEIHQLVWVDIPPFDRLGRV